MLVDVSTVVGAYPFRAVQHLTPEWLLRQMDRLAIDAAWVGDAGAFMAADPTPANSALEARVAGHDRLHAVPTVKLGHPRWETDLDAAVDAGAPAVRVYPHYEGLAGDAPAVDALGPAAAGRGIPLLLMVRFEDARQRHPRDTAPELDGATLRRLARSDPAVRLVVSHASRALVEEVHFGLTPDEAQRILWDVAWIWGPPEDELELLWETVGADRFVFGSGMPLRVPDAAVAKLDLLTCGPEVARRQCADNLQAWLR
jgi:predicted TIM-barrel fold metal-dependent hydrolase